MNDKFRKWLDGDIDVMENITEAALVPDEAGSSVPNAGLHGSFIR